MNLPDNSGKAKGKFLKKKLNTHLQLNLERWV